MRVSIIVAMAKHRVIGNQGSLPWRLPEDLKRFKELTMNHPIIMGRKTFESIGKALDGRTNIVITKNLNFKAPDCVVAGSFSQAMSIARESPGGLSEVFVIGGAEIYRQALFLADRMYVTDIDLVVDGDRYFPPVRWREWREASRTDFPKTKDNPAYSFLVFEKIDPR